MTKSEDAELKHATAFTAKGEAEARRYIAEGRIALRGAGYPAEWLDIFCELLQTRYSVQSEHLGCCIDVGTPQEIQGFNAVMTVEIERRFGKGVIGRLEKESQALFND